MGNYNRQVEAAEGRQMVFLGFQIYFSVFCYLELP